MRGNGPASAGRDGCTGGTALSDPKEIPCPKCGQMMRLVPDSQWRLFEVRTVDYLCPNCLHVEQVKAILVERARKED